jgi:hypothetical protein
MNIQTSRQFATEHPEAVAALIEQGKKAGIAEAIAGERARMKSLVEACGDNHALANELFLKGEDAAFAGIIVKAIATSATERLA